MEESREKHTGASDTTGTIRITAGELSRYHGLACGAVCAAPAERDPQSSTRASQLPGAALPGAGFSALLSHARQTLDDADCAFRVQIPGDDAALERRAAALAGWCQGFLEGYALASEVGDATGLPPDVAELLTDLTNIAAGLESETMTASDENEWDFAEITGFVEVAAMNLYLAGNQPSSQRAGRMSNTAEDVPRQ